MRNRGTNNSKVSYESPWRFDAFDVEKRSVKPRFAAIRALSGERHNPLRIDPPLKVFLVSVHEVMPVERRLTLWKFVWGRMELMRHDPLPVRVTELTSGGPNQPWNQ